MGSLDMQLNENEQKLIKYSIQSHNNILRDLFLSYSIISNEARYLSYSSYMQILKKSDIFSDGLISSEDACNIYYSVVEKKNSKASLTLDCFHCAVQALSEKKYPSTYELSSETAVYISKKKSHSQF